jgi:hypothetical protein
MNGRCWPRPLKLKCLLLILLAVAACHTPDFRQSPRLLADLLSRWSRQPRQFKYLVADLCGTILRKMSLRVVVGDLNS